MISGTPAHDVGATNLTCLANAIYHESRGEDTKGQIAVGYVVMHRVAASGKKSICKVVNKANQFSPVVRTHPKDEKAWKRAVWVAGMVVAKEVRDPVPGALFFHSYKSNPTFLADNRVVARIGGHTFLA